MILLDILSLKSDWRGRGNGLAECNTFSPIVRVKLDPPLVVHIFSAVLDPFGSVVLLAETGGLK
jgi:hypothetical protein